MGIEPTLSAWKAEVLPLNYTRLNMSMQKILRLIIYNSGGGGWIRTTVGVSQQIYSLPPLTTRAPLHYYLIQFVKSVKKYYFLIINFFNIEQNFMIKNGGGGWI